MQELRIGPIELLDGGHRVQATLTIRGKEYPVYFSSPDCVFRPSVEAFVALSIWPAMKWDADVLAEGNISPLFLASLEDVQTLALSWKPGYHRVKLQGLVAQPDASPPGTHVGVFFSLGMDSYFTFLRHCDEVTDLIHVHGFDSALNQPTRRQKISEMLYKSGEHYGKHIIEVETNARSFLDPNVFWGFSHGAVLAAIGHLLSKDFKRFYIAAGSTIGATHPYGVHPDLDPLWSSENLEFVHDAEEVTKVAKCDLLAQHDMALQTLRVCMELQGSAYNCGRCEKCLRGMVYLRTKGALDRCTTFAVPLDLDLVARIKATTHTSLFSFVECLQILEEKGADPDLQAALHKIIDRPSWQKQFWGWALKEHNQFLIRVLKRKRA